MSELRQPFTISVVIPKLDPATRQPVLDADGKPVPERTVGEFTFRPATLRDVLKIEVRKAQLTEGAPVGDDAGYIAAAYATLPLLCLKSPDGWEWDKLDPDQAGDLVTVFAEYLDAEGRFRGKRT